MLLQLEQNLENDIDSLQEGLRSVREMIGGYQGAEYSRRPEAGSEEILPDTSTGVESDAAISTHTYGRLLTAMSRHRKKEPTLAEREWQRKIDSMIEDR